MTGQVVCEWFNNKFSQLSLPSSNAEVLTGVLWGRAEELFSPAYWATQVWLSKNRAAHVHHKIGTTLLEESAACILGGHGMRAEIALAAFRQLRNEGLLTLSAARRISETQLSKLLSDPLPYRDRYAFYRFPRQKASILAPVLRALAITQPRTNDHRSFRDWFLQFRGVGPKTASWITRNWLQSDSVAILDVHICRAGMLAGLFSIRDRPASRYFQMERRFLEFSKRLGVCAGLLDSIIWQHMRICPGIVTSMLQERLSRGTSTHFADIHVA
jgi:N-glycosylase/DNA lyase